jgi:histidine triad (HIT) family protein
MSDSKRDPDCVFCKIIAGEIATKILYQDAELVAFPDHRPLAPVHILIVPREHIPSLLELRQDQALLAGKMLLLATRLAREHGVAEKGFRLGLNTGEEGGQVVPHLHLHLWGGKPLKKG